MTHDSSEKPQDIIKEALLTQCGCGNFQSVIPLLGNCQLDEINKDQRWLGSLLECAVQWSKPEVVQFLLERFQVNINSECSITGLGFGSALIVAIRCNNMVEDLINMGAYVNVATDVTPLTVACTMGNLTMVKKLLDKGADVNLTTSRGSSPLMAASWKRGGQALEIIKCLLDHGAKCDLQNDAGSTALHKAVVRGNAKTVKMLLESRAKILANKRRSTPVLLAVYTNSDEMFDLFQCSQFVEKKDKVDALEHKAASLAPNDMEGVYQLLHQAMKTRYENTSDVLRKPVREPVAAFGNVCESQTLRELEARKGMEDVLLMECLAIEDRLLGRYSICLTKNFNRIWRKLFDAGLYDRALSLVEYGIESLYEDTALLIVMDVLKLESDTSLVSVTHLLYTTERGLQCAIKMLTGIFREGDYLDSWLDDMVLSCLRLLNACIGLDVTDNKPRAQIQAKCIIDLFSLLPPNYHTPLHAATSFLLNKGTPFDIALFKSLVEFLVMCGANIDEKDQAGNIIMARVLQSDMSEDDQREIIDFLLEQGANPAYLKKDASFPCDCTDDPHVLQLLRPYYPLPLQHIAAFAAVNNRIQYEGQVPEMMAKFIDGHR